ncbi:MAG: NAD-dependent epimerase/dehydratase family protein [Promethearchaeota archaeon]
MKVLITGGAGFIRSHLVDFVLAKDYDITVFIVLKPQVHGIDAKPPNYLVKDTKFIKNDI